MPSLPSYINPELNLEPPPALEHADYNDSDDDDRYELVTVRIPVTMKVSELNGVQLDLHALSKTSNTSAGVQVQDGKYVVKQGNSNENDSFRVLVPDAAQAKDSDSDDDSIHSDSDGSQSQKKSKSTNFVLHPSRKAFSRHFVVCANVLEHKTEAELAPLKGPDPVNCKLKHSYSPIPQRQGLKRRWMPLGNPQGARAISPDLISLKEKPKPKLVRSDHENGNTHDALPETPKIKTESAKKRRRSNSHGSSGKASPKKKKKAEATPKSEKRKKAKKSKKQQQHKQDALSV